MCRAQIWPALAPRSKEPFLQRFLQRRTKPHDHIACLFLIFCIHFIALSTFIVTVVLYFHENFMVDDKLQDRKWLSPYNRVLPIYNSC